MMTSQIADRLVELCRKGEFQAAQTELFSPNALSIEPDGAPLVVAEGLAAIQDKGRAFMEGIEQVHNIDVSEPIVAGNYFSVSMTLDHTMKGHGRMTMEEICVYRVEQGKIVCEQFFYAVG